MHTTGQVRVEPVHLRRGGRRLRQAGQDLAAGARSARTPLGSADSSCPGWAAAGVAVRAAQQWCELLVDLAGQAEELGQAVMTAAEAYTRCDEQAAVRTGAAVPG